MRLLDWSRFSILGLSARFVSCAALSVQPSNVSLSTNLGAHDSIPNLPYCSSGLYGYPPWASCRQALGNIPDRSRVLQFYQRLPNAVGDVSVPYRWISSTSLQPSHPSSLIICMMPLTILISIIADGNCAIELTLTGTNTQGRSSSHNIKTAVDRLITTCVGNHGSGGIIHGLGRSPAAVRLLTFDNHSK